MALSHICASDLRQLLAITLAAIIAIGAVGLAGGGAHADDGDNCLPNYDNSCNPQPQPEPTNPPTDNPAGRSASYSKIGLSLAVGVATGFFMLSAPPLTALLVPALTGGGAAVIYEETGGDDGHPLTRYRGAFGCDDNCRWIYTRLGGAREGGE